MADNEHLAPLLHCVEPARQPVLDTTILDSLREVLADEVSSLYAEFFQNSPSDLAELNKACAALDRHEIRTVAHRIKGCCANLGLVSIASACADLEKMADKAADCNIQEAEKNIAGEIERARQHLKGIEL